MLVVKYIKILSTVNDENLIYLSLMKELQEFVSLFVFDVDLYK